VQENELSRMHVEAMRIARGILGFLLGYAFVVLTTEFGFRLLPDRPTHSSDPWIVTAAAVVVLTAGFGGGALAALVARTRVAGFAVLAPLTAETIWLLFFRSSGWRDAVAAVMLLGAVGVGAWVGGGRVT
jgi:hypothetical protein